MTSPMIWVCSTDSQMRALICLNLTRRGFQAREVSSGELEVNPANPPGLIIADVETQAVVSQLIAKYRACSSAPIILLVNNAPSSSQLEKAKFVRWLEKPFAMDRLIGLVHHGVKEGWDGGAV